MKSDARLVAKAVLAASKKDQQGEVLDQILNSLLVIREQLSTQNELLRILPNKMVNIIKGYTG